MLVDQLGVLLSGEVGALEVVVLVIWVDEDGRHFVI